MDVEKEGAQEAQTSHAADLRSRQRRGARWFFWIAALSLINNSASLLSGFFVGLGSTKIIDSFLVGLQAGTIGTSIAIGMDILIALMFVAFGVFALKGQQWAFVLGMFLYAFDALLVFYNQQWLSLVFHALTLWFIFAGCQANRELQALEAPATEKPDITSI